MKTTDLIALGGAGLLGLLLYKQVDDTLEDLNKPVRSISNSYTNLTETLNNTVKEISNTAKETSNFIPYVGGDPNLSPQDEAFYDMEKTPGDQAWLDEKTYSASGYRDVSQIGENIKHTDTEKLDKMRDVVSRTPEGNKSVNHPVKYAGKEVSDMKDLLDKKGSDHKAGFYKPTWLD